MRLKVLTCEALFARLLSGNWCEDEFLIVPSGEKVIPTNDDTIIECV